VEGVALTVRISKALARSLAGEKSPQRGSGSPSKYKNVKTTVGEDVFDSRREAEHWLKLRALERAGAISDLKRQVRFPLTVNGKLVTTYVADFTFTEKGAQVVEDAKGYRTREYINKAKLFEALHGFRIREV
jgi:hypothetical protein